MFPVDLFSAGIGIYYMDHRPALSWRGSGGNDGPDEQAVQTELKKLSLARLLREPEDPEEKRGVLGALAGIVRGTAKWFFFPVSPRSYLKCFLAAWFALLFVWAAVVWWIDPYLCFHRAWGFKQVYEYPYAMIPGMLRNLRYDTVLIGSSMCKNYNISDIDAVAGGRAIKATAAGQTGEDIGKVLHILLKEKNDRELKHLIIGVDLWAFAKGEGVGHWRNYAYLYDRRFSWEYFFSADTLEGIGNYIVTNMASADVEGATKEKDFNRMFGDKVWRFEYSRAVMEEEIRGMDYSPAAASPETMKYLERFLLDPLVGHDRLRVDILFSPYSVYFWSMLLDTGKLEGYLNRRAELAEAVERRCPFVRIHDFQGDESIICDLDNYKDITHFSPKINLLILDGVKSGSHVSGAARVAENNRRLRRLAEEYLPRYRALVSEGRTGGKK